MGCNAFANRNSETTATLYASRKLSATPILRPDCEDFMKFARQLGSKNLNERTERLPALLDAFASAFFGELARHEMWQQNAEVAADLARPLWQRQQKKGRKIGGQKKYSCGASSECMRSSAVISKRNRAEKIFSGSVKLLAKKIEAQRSLRTQRKRQRRHIFFSASSALSAFQSFVESMIGWTTHAFAGRRARSFFCPQFFCLFSSLPAAIIDPPNRLLRALP